jgi:hypothetical protein
MAASARLQKELQVKAKQALQTTTDPVERLRAACLARGAQGIKGLGLYVFFIFNKRNFFLFMFYFSLFRIMDDDGSKNLSFDEFKKGVQEYGLNFTKDEIAELFRMFDSDQNGKIDYEEFIRKLRVCFFLNFIFMLINRI